MTIGSQTLPDFLTLVHVLPPEIERTSGWIREWLTRHERTERLFFLVQPANFIDPDKLQGIEKNACLRGVISIAVVSIDESPGIVLALVRPSEKHCNDVKKLLERLRVPVYSGDFGSTQSVGKFLEANLEGGLNSLAPERNKSRCEEWLDRLLNVSLFLDIKGDTEERLKNDRYMRDIVNEIISGQKSKFRIYQEVCLTEIIKLGPNSKLIPTQLLDDYEEIGNRRCDLLLASAPPESQPLLVLEFDGGHHNTEAQLKKDKVRDELLNRAGLPVVRVSSKNPGVRGGAAPDIPSLPERRKLVETTEPFIGFLLRHLAQELHLTQIALPKQQSPKHDWICREIARRRQDEGKRLRSILGRSVKLRIYSAVLNEADKKFGELDEDQMVALDERELDYAKDADDMNKTLADTGASLVEVEAQFVDNCSGVHACGTLYLSNGDKLLLKTDIVFVKILRGGTPLESVTYLQNILEDSAKMLLLQQACQVSKQNPTGGAFTDDANA